LEQLLWITFIALNATDPIVRMPLRLHISYFKSSLKIISYGCGLFLPMAVLSARVWRSHRHVMPPVFRPSGRLEYAVVAWFALYFQLTVNSGSSSSSLPHRDTMQAVYLVSMGLVFCVDAALAVCHSVCAAIRHRHPAYLLELTSRMMTCEMRVC
jgi:hypothetical protein